jgi:hypothetical protein
MGVQKKVLHHAINLSMASIKTRSRLLSEHGLGDKFCWKIAKKQEMAENSLPSSCGQMTWISLEIHDTLSEP